MVVQKIDRRLAFKSIAALFGTTLIAPLSRAVAQNAEPGMVVTTRLFTDDQLKLVTSFCERIIPATDTPGATEAGVANFIELMLSDWYQPKERESFMAGFAAIASYCQTHKNLRFDVLTPDEQDAVITLAMNKALPGAPDNFFQEARQLVITGYYSSEIGVTVERVYLPVPGHYDGYYLYEKVGRIFSS